MAAQTQNLPARNKANDIRALLNASKKQLEMALPKHLTADRLLRVAMTSIQRTPQLLDCSQQSLLACIMTCAQLGLEPDQFLGQAYLVPFGKVCTLIPGYRGYIALARRSGELQTLSAQVVYSNDQFIMEYGISDTLKHVPALNGDRGKPVGAYCIFKYKDGGYSFDFMSTADIEKIRERSKASGNGPWVTDWDEMAKKTVIKRHAKLAPLSVEFQKAVALEDRAFSGESQMDLMSDEDEDVIDAEAGEAAPELTAADFDKQLPEGVNQKEMAAYVAACAKHYKITAEAVKIEAAANITEFLHNFNKWTAARAKKAEAEKQTTGEATQETKPETWKCPFINGDVEPVKATCDQECNAQARADCPMYPKA